MRTVSLSVMGILLFLGLLFGDSANIRKWKAEGWTKTDFSKATVDLSEVISGGPPRDGIPPIYTPTFETSTEATKWLPESEPVMVYKSRGEARAYPLRILLWHEIVNDTMHDKSFIVTYCPLCNSGIIFDTMLDGQKVKFGVSGKLRNSDMVMYDHRHESWWQQLTGEAIAGKDAGSYLKMLPSHTVSFKTFKARFPNGEVLSQDTGYSRAYGANPYVGYDSLEKPFLMLKEVDDRLPALSRVIGFQLAGKAYLVPLASMQDKAVAQAVAGEHPLVLFNLSESNSAVDARRVKNSKLIDMVTVYANPEKLRFVMRDGHVVDSKYGFSWNAFGEGSEGGKIKKRLEPVENGMHFAFAWLAFHEKSEFLEPAAAGE